MRQHGICMCLCAGESLNGLPYSTRKNIDANKRNHESWNNISITCTLFAIGGIPSPLLLRIFCFFFSFFFLILRLLSLFSLADFLCVFFLLLFQFLSPLTNFLLFFHLHNYHLFSSLPFPFHVLFFSLPFPLLLTIQNKCRYQEVISPLPLLPRPLTPLFAL